MTTKRIVITPGEPAGIGPDVMLEMAQRAFPAELVVIGDPDFLTKRAIITGMSTKFIECNPDAEPEPHQEKILKIIPYKLHGKSFPGELNPVNASYVLETLKIAADLCLNKKADALVTGPVQKSVMNDAGVHFSGHTEFFADYCNVRHTVMLFVVDELKVALATTHLPLAKVSHAITMKSLRSTFAVLNDGLKHWFHIESPKILVCGLNPHAGEYGYLGREEIETITPVVNELRAQGYKLEGPLPADTVFTRHFLKRADAVLAMYHDQALPLVKYMGFNRAVNVTLGLPFIRTSVDHGTALDIAGSGRADAGSMEKAVELAIKLNG